jgi:hypothetical protein
MGQSLPRGAAEGGTATRGARPRRGATHNRRRYGLARAAAKGTPSRL